LLEKRRLLSPMVERGRGINLHVRNRTNKFFKELIRQQRQTQALHRTHQSVHLEKAGYKHEKEGIGEKGNRKWAEKFRKNTLGGIPKVGDHFVVSTEESEGQIRDQGGM